MGYSGSSGAMKQTKLDGTSLRKCKFGWLIYDCVSLSERYLDRPPLERRSDPPPSVRLSAPRF